MSCYSSARAVPLLRSSGPAVPTIKSLICLESIEFSHNSHGTAPVNDARMSSGPDSKVDIILNNPGDWVGWNREFATRMRALHLLDYFNG